MLVSQIKVLENWKEEKTQKRMIIKTKVLLLLEWKIFPKQQAILSEMLMSSLRISSESLHTQKHYISKRCLLLKVSVFEKTVWKQEKSLTRVFFFFKRQCWGWWNKLDFETPGTFCEYSLRYLFFVLKEDFLARWTF